MVRWLCGAGLLLSLMTGCLPADKTADDSKERQGLKNHTRSVVSGAYTAILDDSNHLLLDPIDSEHLQEGKRLWLEVKFESVRRFPLRKIRLAINGVRAFHQDFFSLKPVSRWVGQGEERRLRINLSRLRFEDGLLAREKIQKVQSNGGQVRLWLRTPLQLTSGELIVRTPVEVSENRQRRRPSVVLDVVRPNKRSTFSRRAEFHFESAGQPAQSFECRLDRGAWQECASPAVYEGLRPGMHRFRVRAIGETGRSGPPARYRWRVRRMVERFFGVHIVKVTPSERVTQASELTVHFKQRWGWLYKTQCRLDRGPFKACQSPVTYKGLSEGEHRVTIRSRFGFWWGRFFRLKGRTITDYHWEVDRKGPSLDWVAVPPSHTNQSSALFEFKSTDPAAKFVCHLDGEELEECESPLELSDLSEGVHELTVQSQDSAENRSNRLDYTWTVDQTPPVLEFTGISPQDTVTNATTLTASFASSEPASFQCRLNEEEATSCQSPMQYNDLNDGDHVIEIVGTDAAGNQSDPMTYEWTVDITDPKVTIQMTSPTSLPTSQDTATFDFITTEPGHLECELNDELISDCVSPLTLSELPEGTNRLVVTPFDAVGNEGDSDEFEWMTDYTAPELVMDSVTPSASPTDSTSIEIEFSSSEAATVTCDLDGAGAVACASPFVANQLADGVHTVVFNAVDAAGNVAEPLTYQWEVLTEVTATIDRVLPSENPTNVNTASFEISMVGATEMVCALDGGAFEACTSPMNYANLSDGLHRFEVRPIHPVTGAQEEGDAYEWTIDTTAPVLSLVSMTPDWSPTASPDLTLSWTSDDAILFDCSVDGGPSAPCGSPFSVSGLGDGVHTVTVVGEDHVGNRSQPLTHTWTIDTSALVISDVRVTEITSNSARISWTTNFGSTSQVNYGEGTVLNQTTSDGTMVQQHSVVLTGLKRFTFYTFEVVSQDRDGRSTTSSRFDFRTQF